MPDETNKPKKKPGTWSAARRATFPRGRYVLTLVAVVRADFTRRQRSLRVLAVTSGKGGVGKTTVSVNLATALARSGQRVLLFDADLGMASIHIFTGVTPRGTLLDVVEGRVALDVDSDNQLTSLPYTDFNGPTKGPRGGAGAYSLGKDGKLALGGSYRTGSDQSDDIISWQ